MSISQVSKGPPYPHAHALTSQTCPPPTKRLSYLNPDRPPDCACGRSASALQCVGSTPPAGMCTKVSGFAFLVQAWTCGRGQGRSFRQQKTAGHNRSHRSKNVMVGWLGKGLLFVSLNKKDILFRYQQAPGESVRLSCSQEPFTPPPPANFEVLLLYSVSFVIECWRPHLAAAELTHTTTMQEHAMFRITAAIKHFSSTNSKSWSRYVCSSQRRHNRTPAKFLIICWKTHPKKRQQTTICALCSYRVFMSAGTGNSGNLSPMALQPVCDTPRQQGKRNPVATDTSMCRSCGNSNDTWREMPQ